MIASIGDYWDEKTISEVVTLVREYEDLFPQSFTKMKGIKGEVEEMKIALKPHAKPINKRPYRLNPRVKQTVKAEIEKIFTTSLIFPVEQSDWISPIVIQDKKTVRFQGQLKTAVTF